MQATLRSIFSVLLASIRMRLITISRYPGADRAGYLHPDRLRHPADPAGRASAGAMQPRSLRATPAPATTSAYMLIGSCIFTIVINAFWHVAYWLRWEQESGTLESALPGAHPGRVWVVAGTALYTCIRSTLSRHRRLPDRLAAC